MTSSTTTEDLVRQLVAGFIEQPVERVAPGSHLAVDLQMDSLDRVELGMLIEDEFGIEVTDDEAENCATVADWVNVVREHLARREKGMLT